MIPGELEQTLRDDRTPLLAASIRANRDRIVEAWNTELHLSGRRPSTLGAHATELLDELARSLADLERDDTPRSRRDVAPEHERPCFDDGDDLHTVRVVARIANSADKRSRSRSAAREATCCSRCRTRA